MPSSRIERDRAAAGWGLAESLATAGGALLMILALAAAIVFVIDVFGRLGANRPLLAPELFDRVMLVFGVGFALASLLALPAALAAPFARAGDLRSHLALVPGAVVALVLLIAAIVAVVALAGASLEASIALVFRQLLSTFSAVTFLLIPISMALAAALAGGQTPGSTAVAAAPVALAGFCGMAGGLSIVSLLLGLLLPLLAAAVALAMLYAMAPARAVTPWLVGIALAFGMMLFTATGLMTPTEAIGLIALFGIPIALLVRTLALRRPAGAILRQAATETIALVLIIAASAMTGIALVIAQLNLGLGELVTASAAIMIAIAAGVLIASVLLTPVLALGIALPSMFRGFRGDDLEQTYVGVALILVGLAAIAARAGRRGPEASPWGLPPAAAAIAAAVFLVLALAVVLVPGLALAPVRALRI